MDKMHVLTMETRLKRYTVTIRGRVQHVGYRGIIESTARKLDIKGYIFNDIDNSVKIVCEGLQKSVQAVPKVLLLKILNLSY